MDTHTDHVDACKNLSRMETLSYNRDRLSMLFLAEYREIVS